MAPRLPQLHPKELIRAFEQLGFIFRQKHGSHVILRHPISKRIVSVPFHPRDIKRGLLFGLLKQGGISQEQFRDIIGK